MTKMFPGPGLSEDQWQHVRSLAATLSPEQVTWISGYFSGLGDAFRLGTNAAATNLAPPVAAAAPVALATRTLNVLYASETGNSAALAKALADAARTQGIDARATNMADYKVRGLKDEQDLIVVTATHGEGDPPQAGVAFFEFLESRKAPKLPNLRFAVLALGDSTYEKYCEAGKRIDRRFEELGAQRIADRVDCDVDYEEPAAAWHADMLSRLAPSQAAATPATAAVAVASGAVPVAVSAFDKKNPFPARVIDNIVLTGRGSSKETRHIELSLEGSGLSYQPGDALGVVPRNDSAVVAALIEQLKLDPNASVTVKQQTLSLQDALNRAFEITAATPRFIEHWASVTGAAELKRLASPEEGAARTAFLNTHHVLDIVTRFPAPGIEPASLLAGLRPLQPRLYSIASSLAAAPDEVHLTVSTVRYDLHDVPRAGVASGYLASLTDEDATLPVYIQPSAHFHLPTNDVPIIMIGAGTGVAPYRAFMQQREVEGASGRSWLFFGERNFRSDFLYQVEWQGLLKSGVLSRMDIAFSRDGADKVYVQDRLRAQGRDIYAWLEEGAHLYVCGDAARMAPDVHGALANIVETHGGLSDEAAKDYLASLQRDRRYLLDVY